MTINVDSIAWLSSLVIALSAFYLMWVLSSGTEEISVGSDASVLVKARFTNKHWFLRLFGSLIVALAVPISALPLAKKREQLRIRLIQAGEPGGLSADEFWAARIIALVFFMLAGMYFDFDLGSTPFITTVLAFLGFFYPNIWLTGYIAKRRRKVFRELPDLLDLLRLAVEAGLDFGSALKVVVERSRSGPLLEELDKVERDMALGRTRQQALRDFAERVAMSEINSFVLALIQADQLGASIGTVLKVQSDMARKRRWQLAETMVNKLPMKLLGPLVVFIFPASFIILFTPLVIRYMQGE